VTGLELQSKELVVGRNGPTIENEVVLEMPSNCLIQER